MIDKRPHRSGDPHAGDFLKRAREARGIALDDVSNKTRIKIEFLRLLEEGRIAELPAEVFVRGFVRAYAVVVGAAPEEAARLINAQFRDREAAKAPPVAARGAELTDGEANDSVDGRRRFGVVLVVLVILIAATLTLSLLLRRPGPSSGGLSRSAPAPTATLTARG